MILRRIADAIRKQNWSTVVLEVLIVVSGIFIGLQVDDWNNLRKDRSDEQHYLERLHDEIRSAEKLSARLLDRRLGRQAILFDLLDAVFVDAETTSLTDTQCLAIAGMHYYNVVVPGLSAAEELTASGRMDILRDRELRAALGALKQARDATHIYISIQNLVAYDLPHEYPELITQRAYFDPDQQEVHAQPDCNLSGMRQNQKFLNDLSTNADAYDAYVRDGLSPWAEQMRSVHRIIDRNLGIQDGTQ